MARVQRRGGVYYYRARVPKDLRKVLRRVELKVSLKCADRDTAEELALEMQAGQLRLCRALRQAGPMTADQVDKLVGHYLTTFKVNREGDAIALGELSPEFGAERREWVTGELAAAEDDLLHNRLAATEQLAHDLLRETGTSYGAIGEESFRRLCFRLLSARVDTMREEAKRLPSSAVQVGARVPEGVPDDAAEGPRVSALVEAYLAHRDTSAPMPENTRLETAAALKALVSLLGDPPLVAVRNRDAQDFLLRFSQLPRRWRSKYKGRNAADVLAETEGQELHRVNPATVKKELALIKAFWSWAVRREELPRNAFDAAKPPKVGKAKDKRRPFSDTEIAAIRPLIEAQRLKRPERYWVTLLVAYTGARLEEIAQLRQQDVYETPDGWAIRIRAESGSVKTEVSERDLPLHSKVIERGFLEYLKAATGVRLFAEDERKGKMGAPISKWFAWELDKLNFAERAKKGMHSFRHTMRDKLRSAGVDAVARREILGHAHEDTEDAVYGDPTSIKERRESLERITLPL